MSNFVETQTTPPQLARAVEEVFTEQHPSLQDIVLGDMQTALAERRPDLAYEAAGVVVPLQEFKLEELPAGVSYNEAKYGMPDFAAEGLSPAEQAKRIFDRVGSICFGAPGELQIYAPDGRHTFTTGDLPKLINFLGEKGYKQSDVVAPEGTLIQPKPPRVDTKMLPIGAPETEFDSAALIGSATKIDIIREMTQAARENAYVPRVAAVEKSAIEVQPTAPRTSSFSASEQLLTVSRVLLDKTLTRHKDGKLEERSLRSILLSKYKITEQELDAASNEVLAAEHRLNIFADTPEARQNAKGALQTHNRFNVTTSQIINTALREFIATTPSDVSGGTNELSIAQLEALARAEVRKRDVKLAQHLVGNDQEIGELTLCTTNTLVPSRLIPLEIKMPTTDETRITTHIFTLKEDETGLNTAVTVVEHEPTTHIPRPVIGVEAEPSIVVPTPTAKKQATKSGFIPSLKNGFRKFGRRIGAAARSFNKQYA